MAKSYRQQTFLLDPISWLVLHTCTVCSLAINFQVVLKRLLHKHQWNERIYRPQNFNARFSFCPLWSHFHATDRLCSEWALWGSLGFVERDLVRNSRGISLRLWLFGLYQYLPLFFFFWTWTCFSLCKYFSAYIHHLSLFHGHVLFWWMSKELSSASAHVRWKLCGRSLPICFAIPGYSSNLCTVCSPRCSESSKFQEERAKWKSVFQHLEQRWLLAIL